jgi:WD40 repeat protein
MKNPPAESLRLFRATAMGPGTVAVFEGHRLPVLAAAISPDQLLALSGSCQQLDDHENCLEGELILWDLASKQEVRRWTGHTDWIRSVVFTLDGKYAISGSADGSLIRWEISTAAPVQEYRGHTDAIISLSVSADRNYLLSGSTDGTMIVWNLESGRPFQIFEGNLGSITSTDFAPDHQSVLAATEAGQLILWNINSGQLVRSYLGHTARVNAAVISPDGSQILSSSEDLSLRLWDVETGEIIQQQIINCRPNQLGFGQDGSAAFVSCESILFQWNVQNWQEKQHYRGHSGYINAFDISSDGRLGLTAGQDGTLRLWSLNGQFDFKTENTGIRDVYAVVVHPDGKHLLLAAESPLLWNVSEGKVVRSYSGFQGYIAPGAAAVSPDGRYLAAAGGIWPPEDVRSLMIWEVDSGEVACQLVGHQTMLRSVAFSPDSQMLLAGSQNPQNRSGDLILWDIKTCQIIRHFESTEDITSIAINPDGSWAATGQGYQPVVTLWDVSTGREIRRLQIDQNAEVAPILDVAFGPDGHSVLGSSLANLYLWDAETGRLMHQFIGHAGMPWSIEVRADGLYAVSGSQLGEVILWNFSTGEELYRFPAHTQPVFNVAFSIGGSHVFSMSIDGQLNQWQIPEKSTQELRRWVMRNRHTRPLTCEERVQYRVEPVCKP